MIVEVDPEDLRILRLKRTGELDVAAHDERDALDVHKLAHRIDDALRLLDSFDEFHALALGEIEIAGPRRRHAPLGVLQFILNPDRTMNAEDRFGEELFEAA